MHMLWHRQRDWMTCCMSFNCNRSVSVSRSNFNAHYLCANDMLHKIAMPHAQVAKKHQQRDWMTCCMSFIWSMQHVMYLCATDMLHYITKPHANIVAQSEDDNDRYYEHQLGRFNMFWIFVQWTCCITSPFHTHLWCLRQNTRSLWVYKTCAFFLRTCCVTA
jgi:hypothetical protein